MSVQGQLRGQSWTQMLADNVQQSPGLSQSQTSSPITVPSDDVMKLPREDMTTFGRVPAWDNFVLVTCERCDKIVKIEAFESHMALRHGSKSERSAYHRVLAARAAASLQSCEVKLTPCSTTTHSSSSSVGGAEAESQLPSSSCASPIAAAAPSPLNQVEPEPEPMDTTDHDGPPPGPTVEHSYNGEEADSTTNNVISIPDTDGKYDDMMANIEIITEGQSLLDKMDSKFNFGQTTVSNPPTPNISLSSSSDTSRNIRIESDTSTSGQPPTHYITVSPLSKPSPNKLKVVGTVGRMMQPHVAHPAAPSVEKKSSRDREYDPNKHCGVLDPETKKPCTRSLTCKSHSVYLKRKVLNRSGEFDELLAHHKAEKEAAAAKLASVTTSGSDDASSNSGSSILERRLKQASGQTVTHVSPVVTQPPRILVSSPNFIKTVPKEMFCEDTLYYTTDHPKPLAVCTFGGRRLGGLFVADRSKLLTRKVMKLAMSNSGVRSVPIVRQQTLPYIVNFQGGSASIPGIPARIGTIKLANTIVSNISTLQPQQIIVQDAFKPDLQEFKGGLKFELPNNIHQTLPSGSESIV